MITDPDFGTGNKTGRKAGVFLGLPAGGMRVAGDRYPFPQMKAAI